MAPVPGTDHDHFLIMLAHAGREWRDVERGVQMQAADKNNVYLISFAFSYDGELADINLEVVPINGPNEGGSVG